MVLFFIFSYFPRVRIIVTFYYCQIYLSYDN